MTILACLLLPAAVAANAPSFFEPYRVLFNTVYSGSHCQSSGLWKYKPQDGYGTAAVFQTATAESYATGAREQGTLTFGPFELPDDPEIFLSFWYLWETETSLSYDVMTVEVSDSGLSGPYETLVSNSALRGHHPSNKWAAMKWVALGAYAGEEIYIRFSFDTIDSIANNYKGWKIDFLTIYGSHFSSVFAPKRILDLSFDERDNADTTARDYSGHGHHGIISEADHRAYSGIDEHGGYLDARDGLDVGIASHADFDNLKAFALDAWVSPTTTTTGFIISRNGQLALRYNTDRTVTIYVYDGTGWHSATSTISLPLDQWSHVAVIYDGMRQTVLYVNGDFAGFGLSLGTMASGTGDLHVGTLWGSSSNRFKGYIGDIRLASIESWMSADVQILNDSPVPNVYRWDLYRLGGQWHREGSVAAINETQLGGDIDLSDPEIQNLVNEIGVPTDVVTHQGEIWSRIVTLWNWLKDARLPDSSSCNDFHEGYLVQDIAHQVMLCGGYYTMNGGTCGPHARMITGLMRLAGVHPSGIGMGQCRYETAAGGYASHAWGAVHLLGRWIAIDTTTLYSHDPDVDEIRSLSKLSDKFDYANPFDWIVPPGGIIDYGIPMVEPSFDGGKVLEPVLLEQPADGMRVSTGGAVLVAGRIASHPMAPLPDFVVVNGIEVPMHADNYFITSIPAAFTAGEMEIYVTTDDGLESATVTVYETP